MVTTFKTVFEDDDPRLAEALDRLSKAAKNGVSQAEFVRRCVAGEDPFVAPIKASEKDVRVYLFSVQRDYSCRLSAAVDPDLVISRNDGADKLMALSKPVSRERADALLRVLRAGLKQRGLHRDRDSYSIRWRGVFAVDVFKEILEREGVLNCE
jgi:hypothetical protein